MGQHSTGLGAMLELKAKSQKRWLQGGIVIHMQQDGSTVTILKTLDKKLRGEYALIMVTLVTDKPTSQSRSARTIFFIILKIQLIVMIDIALIKTIFIIILLLF